MKNIVIIGADDLGKEVVWLIEDINKNNPTYVILGFLDDDVNKIGKEFHGYNVLGKIDYLEELSKGFLVSAVLGVTSPEKKQKIIEKISQFVEWENLIHPSVVIAESCKYGIGNMFFPNVTVSVDSVLGSFGLYHIHSTICSDCRIGDFSSFMTGTTVSGKTIIDDGCFLEAGSCVYPNLRIGKNVHLCIGAIATKDYKDNSIVNEGSKGIFAF